jgi:ubiquinone/menaquinone biosynthesis C-methylase UbiE
MARRATMLRMTSPETEPMNPGAVRLAYDSVARLYADRFRDTRGETALDLAMIDSFADAVTGDADPRILDAGCGAGRMSRYLVDRGCTVQGVDGSPGMIAMARRDHPDIDFSVAELASVPFPDNSFAGIMLWYSIIHTPPPELPAVLAEAVRLVRPGGHLLFGFQSGTGIRDVAPSYRALGHEVRLERYLYTADDVTRILDGLGAPEVCRFVRRAQEGERDDQTVVLARLGVG